MSVKTGKNVAMGKLDRLYRRLGARYTDLLIGASLAAILAFTALHPLEGIAYLGFTPGEYAKVLVVGMGCMLVAALFWIPVIRRATAPIRDFARSDSSTEHAAHAWDAVVGRVPRSLAKMALIVVIGALPPTLYAGYLVDLPAHLAAISYLVLSLLLTGTFILVYLAWEAALTPVVRDLDAVLPERSAEPPRWASLSFKLLAVPAVASLYTGILVAGIVRDSFGETGRVLAGAGTALLVSLTLSLAMTLLLRRSVIAPTADLIAATGRVRAGDLSQAVPLTTADELGTLSKSFNEMMGGLREREALQSALEAYVHPEVVERLVEEGTMLEGRELEVTVLFIDVRDFTSYAETVSPREAVVFLNRFFSVAVPILEALGGHANKFVGDGLLAAFGAPNALPDHGELAVTAACRIVDAVEREFHGELRIGIGINSGDVLVGTVGGGGHLEFTLIGDTVNVAARVEQLTKQTGDAVLLTGATKDLLDEPAPDLESRGEVHLKGKAGTTEVFALPRWSREPTSPAPASSPAELLDPS